MLASILAFIFALPNDFTRSGNLFTPEDKVIFNAKQNRFSQTMNSSKSRIFVVGLPKAGTTSLDALLKGAGYNSCHQRCIPGRLDVDRICTNYRNHLPLLKDFDEFDAFTQLDLLWDCNNAKLSCRINCWPQLTFIRELDEQYPGSKFILNTRNVANHVDSIKRWDRLGDRIDKNPVPFLMHDNKTLETRLADWIVSHNNFIRRYFANSERMIEVDIEDPVSAGRRLSEFLNINATFPHANANH